MKFDTSSRQKVKNYTWNLHILQFCFIRIFLCPSVLLCMNLFAVQMKAHNRKKSQHDICVNFHNTPFGVRMLRNNTYCPLFIIFLIVSALLLTRFSHPLFENVNSIFVSFKVILLFARMILTRAFCVWKYAPFLLLIGWLCEVDAIHKHTECM